MPLNEQQKRNLHRNNKVKFHALARPCVDCNLLWHPFVMSFDHVDRNLKKGDVSDMMIKSPEVFDQEMAKCEVVCYNCHRIREYVRDVHALGFMTNRYKQHQQRLYEQLIEFLSGGALLKQDAYDHVEIGIR